MRILKEDNDTPVMEELPISFVTDMMSKGWDEVGYLKQAAAGIKEAYTGTAKIEELMQDLMDAYLVFIGQLELYLNKETDITTSPEEPEVKADNKVEDEEKPEEADESEEPEEAEAETVEPAPALPEAEFEMEPAKTPMTRTPAPVAVMDDDFDFFVDFDEPDMSQGPVTDAELYDEEGAPKTRRLNG
jgi:hypothetical protein